MGLLFTNTILNNLGSWMLWLPMSIWKMSLFTLWHKGESHCQLWLSFSVNWISKSESIKNSVVCMVKKIADMCS